MNKKLLRTNLTEKMVNQNFLEEISLLLENVSSLKLLEEKQVSAKKDYSDPGRIF